MIGFSRTLRSLKADGMRATTVTLGLALGFLAIWGLWLALARVALYEVSETARLEVERVYPVSATVGGRVVATELLLSREVREGEVLVEVEAEREILETNAQRAQMQALEHQLQAMDREIEAEEQALHQTRQAARAAVSEARQKVAAVEAAARHLEDQGRRMAQLEQRGLVAQSEFVKARAEAEARRADVRGAVLAVDRQRAEQVAAERTREARIAALRRSRAELAGEHERLVSMVARHEREADRRRIRAPMSGRLGEVIALQVGAVVREGERLASIVPEGRVRLAAEFPPTAVGRIRPGQSARLRLDGFPWLRYGRVPATVTRVASEPRDQRVRVELALAELPDLPVAVQHGLSGTVEIEVERVAPAVLVARAVGYVLAGAEERPDRRTRAATVAGSGAPRTP